MRTLLVSPFPRSFLLSSKLLGGVSVALLQVFSFIVIGHLFFRGVYLLSGVDFSWDIHPPAITDLKVSLSLVPPAFLEGILPSVVDPVITKVAAVPQWLQAYVGYITIIPALVLAGLMLGSLALFMSSVIKQLENFAGVMNFVIFPMFFASSALYPLWRIREASPPLYEICRLNPFTYAVELIRFALHGQLDVASFLIVTGCTALFLGAAIYAYNPSKGLLARRGGPGGGA
jgi:ABC-2 type transport system permease protein